MFFYTRIYTRQKLSSTIIFEHVVKENSVQNWYGRKKLTLFKFESIQYFSLFEQFSLSVLEANFALLKKLVFFVLNRLLAASLYSPYVNSFLFLFHKNNANIRIVKTIFPQGSCQTYWHIWRKINLEYACFVPFEENSLCTPWLLHSIIPMRILIWGKLVRFLSKKTCIAYIMLV